MATRMQRLQLAQETIRILREGWYLNEEVQQVSIEASLAAAVAGSRFFSPDDLARLMTQPPPASPPTAGLQVRVVPETAIQGIRYLLDRQAPAVLALNFASAKHPGGGFLSGAEAQEESLARSSGLYPCLTRFMQEMYHFHRQQRSPFYSDRMIYAPQVPLFRDHRHLLLNQPYLVSFISAPAVNAGVLRRQAPEQLMALAPAMRQRVGYVLGLAQCLGYRYLVLGAWGCGVFANEPADVADHFRYHLIDNPRFAGAFDRVRFSIYDQTPEQRVLGAFQAAF